MPTQDRRRRASQRRRPLQAWGSPFRIQSILRLLAYGVGVSPAGQYYCAGLVVAETGTGSVASITAAPRQRLAATVPVPFSATGDAAPGGKGGQAPWRQRFSRCQTNLRHGASPHFPPTLRSSIRIGESKTRGLSQFSFDENGTLPCRCARGCAPPRAPNASSQVVAACPSSADSVPLYGKDEIPIHLGARLIMKWACHPSSRDDILICDSERDC